MSRHLHGITRGALVVLSLVAIPIFAAADASAAPIEVSAMRVVSINVCADQLVIELARPGQILSLTHLSHDPAASHHFATARQYPPNRGRAEDVLPWQPDLVIAGNYTQPSTIGLLRDMDLRVEMLPIAESIGDVLDNIQLVAGWLGMPARGRQISHALQQRLARLETELAAVPGVGEQPRAAVYDPNGYTVGVESLRGEILARSGWHNVAAERGIRRYGQLPLEALIRLKPDVLVVSPYSDATYSRAQSVTDHRALKQGEVHPEVITLHSRDTICGGPWLIDIIEDLAARRIAHELHLSTKGTRQ